MKRFEQLCTSAQDRSRIYWLLSRFFIEPPSLAFLAELGNSAGEAIAGTEPGIGEALTELRQALTVRDLNAAVEELNVEFVRLFRGIREGYGLPPPYESLYREGRVLGETTTDVQSHYRAQGFGVIDESTGPQDHIGAELKYLAFLCHRESEAWQQGDMENGWACLFAEGEFLDRHLLRWVPVYCQQVRTNTVQPFFRAAADLTAITIDQDFRQVGAWLKEFATGMTEKSGQ